MSLPIYCKKIASKGFNQITPTGSRGSAKQTPKSFLMGSLGGALGGLGQLLANFHGVSLRLSGQVWGLHWIRKRPIWTFEDFLGALLSTMDEQLRFAADLSFSSANHFF